MCSAALDGGYQQGRAARQDSLSRVGGEEVFGALDREYFALEEILDLDEAMNRLAERT